MQRELLQAAPEGDAVPRGESTISDLARIYDVSLRTLRFYEDKGLLHPRRQGTARFYRPADRIRLELILKGKRLGFTLAEIHELMSSREKQRSTDDDGEVDSADLTVSLDHNQIKLQIAHLERQRDDLDAAIIELRAAHARMSETVA